MVVIVVMVVAITVMAVTVMRRCGHQWQLASQPSSHSLVWISFGGDQHLDTALAQSHLQAAPGAACDQQVRAIQRVRRLRADRVGAFVKTLLFVELQQGFVNDLLVLNVINPKLAAHAGVFGDGFAVLAGYGNFHGVYLSEGQRVWPLAGELATIVPYRSFYLSY